MTIKGEIVVTGATGFVGEALCAALPTRGFGVRRAVRVARRAGDHALGDFGPHTPWPAVLEGASCIMHLAARTHVLHDTAADPDAAYRAINVDATVHLARSALKAGVKQFVFLSSIKVNGEATTGVPFTEQSVAQPLDAYGRSKLEAEQVLADITRGTDMALTVLRPPLVYGPGVKANFLRLMRFAARGVPLPLAGIHNRRSLVYLGNLVDALVTCAENRAAHGRTFLVSDTEAPSTPELIRRMAGALHTRPRLFSVPLLMLKAGTALLGRADQWRRLSDSLEIDASAVRQALNWSPPHTLEQGLQATAKWYHEKFPSQHK
jgi:nucleoside-diphosphate-sugar epimerase